MRGSLSVCCQEWAGLTGLTVGLPWPHLLTISHGLAGSASAASLAAGTVWLAGGICLGAEVSSVVAWASSCSGSSILSSSARSGREEGEAGLALWVFVEGYLQGCWLRGQVVQRAAQLLLLQPWACGAA